MQRDEPQPVLAAAWLNRARENLELARLSDIPGTYSWELLAYHAQPAAELAIKAVYHRLGMEFEWTHDLEILGKALEDAGVAVSDGVKRAVSLTRYAVRTRYPGMAPPVTRQEYDEALVLASAVVKWAAEVMVREDPVPPDADAGDA